MELLEIQARKIVAIFEEDLDGLEKIKTALDTATLSSTNEKEKEAINYLTSVFYPIIVKTIEGIKGKSDG